MKNSIPRHKRLNRKGRLNAAFHWLPQYCGKNMVKGYSKHFGVNKLCAALELWMLGYDIPAAYLELLRAHEARRRQLSEQKKQLHEIQEQQALLVDSDETFRFIAGTTPNGAPYGLPWDEADEI